MREENVKDWVSATPQGCDRPDSNQICLFILAEEVKHWLNFTTTKINLLDQIDVMIFNDLYVFWQFNNVAHLEYDGNSSLTTE